MRHWVIFGIVYTVVYFPLAVIGINAEGKGTGAFLVPILTWIFIFGALYVSGRPDKLRNRIFFFAFMLTHYLVTASFIPDLFTEPRDTETGFWHTWEMSREYIFVTAAWYLLGQIIIWIAYVRKISRERLR
jgi:hypothetical protein